MGCGQADKTYKAIICGVRTEYPMWGADKTYKTYKAIICGVRTKYGPHILYYENCPFATVFCGVVFPGAVRICSKNGFSVILFNENLQLKFWNNLYYKFC